MSIVVAVAVCFAFAIEAMTGFGSIVLALSIGALVLDLQTLMLWLVPLNLLLTVPLTLRYRRFIDFTLLLKTVMPLMAVGTGIGVLCTAYIPVAVGKLLFAALICWFASRSLLASQPVAHSPHYRGWLIAVAGVTHGLFASGGPLLVYALAHTALDKQRFRATLLFVWMTLNGSLALWFAATGQLAGQAQNLLLLAPCALAGLGVGNYLHHKLPAAQFLRLVFSVLLLVGLILLISSVRQILL